MKKIIHIFILILLIISCKENKRPNNLKEMTGSDLGNYYFEFDEVYHYTTNFDLRNVKPKTAIDYQILKVLYEEPETISDSLYIDSLTILSFHLNKVEPEFIKPIKELFREKKHNESISAECIPVYRDILVFKKNNSIIGIAKVCFSCMQHNIVGTNENTREFGQSGDYERLNLLLIRNKEL